MKNQNLALIGLGEMGSALGAAMLQKGVSLTVWNRTSEKAHSMSSLGALVSDSIENTIKHAELIIFCLSNHGVTLNLLNQVNTIELLTDTTIIQLSSMTSNESLELGNLIENNGGRYLAGQILSFTDEVLAGTGNIVCSGNKDAFVECKSILDAAAGNAHFVGEGYSAAPVFDKAHLSFTLGTYLALMHGAAMCAKGGVDLKAWCEFNLNYLRDNRITEELEILSEQMCTDSFDKGLDASVHIWKDAMSKTIEESDLQNIDQAHLHTIASLVKQVYKDGLEDKELGILFKKLQS